MSIVGPNGEDFSTDREVENYTVGNISLDTNARPGDKLKQALEGARKMAEMQISMAARQQADASGLHIPAESIRVQAMAEASKITDPFQMEPCAQAVFMLLATEISQRDEIIKKLNDRIEKLECFIGPEKEFLSGAGRQN